MSDKTISVQLTEASIDAMLGALAESATLVTDTHAFVNGVQALRAALPTVWPNDTLAWVTSAAGTRYGPLWKVDLGWSIRPGGSVHYFDSDTPSSVEPVKVMPNDHISIPRSLADFRSPDGRKMDMWQERVRDDAILRAVNDALDADRRAQP